MRVFAALEVPGPVLDSLVAFQREVAATGADVKLVERENLHFTLRFMGEITEAQAKEAVSRLGGVSAPGGSIEVRGAGAFPKVSGPRVVWAGVAKGGEEVVSGVARDVSTALSGIGEEDSRAFRPHLTMGRVRSMRNVQALAELLGRNADREFGRAAVTEFKLKSSRLTPQGPVYSDIGVFALR